MVSQSLDCTKTQECQKLHHRVEEAEVKKAYRKVCVLSYFDDDSTIPILKASRTGVTQGASGKVGGLIAKWAYSHELIDLSFPEHIRLAELHNGVER